MVKQNGLHTDFVDRLEEEWRKKRFNYSTAPLAIGARIQRAAFYFQAQIGRLAAACELNSREFMALSALWRSGPPFALHPMELLEEYFIPAATLTRQLDRLTGLGLVERELDPNDRRAVLVRLTPRAHKLVDDAMRHRVTDQPEFTTVEQLSARELDMLNRLLRKLLLLFEEQTSLRSARPRTRRYKVENQSNRKVTQRSGAAGLKQRSVSAQSTNSRH
jgi:DNA-binding MarR family transcriptional regulator